MWLWTTTYEKDQGDLIMIDLISDILYQEQSVLELWWNKLCNMTLAKICDSLEVKPRTITVLRTTGWETLIVQVTFLVSNVTKIISVI